MPHVHYWGTCTLSVFLMWKFVFLHDFVYGKNVVVFTYTAQQASSLQIRKITSKDQLRNAFPLTELDNTVESAAAPV